jgi:hypothetical protein
MPINANKKSLAPLQIHESKKSNHESNTKLVTKTMPINENKKSLLRKFMNQKNQIMNQIPNW